MTRSAALELKVGLSVAILIGVGVSLLAAWGGKNLEYRLYYGGKVKNEIRALVRPECLIELKSE